MHPMIRNILLSLVLGVICSTINLGYAAEPRTILVLGDSLSAGYGLPQGTGWVNLLEKKLKPTTETPATRMRQADRLNYNVVNASISGETSQGGRNRLAALLQKHHPHIVILALGANDGLRGFPITSTRENLNTMITQARQQQAKVLLIGAQLPPNYGKRYIEDFSKLYTQLAKQRQVVLIPTIFAGLSDGENNFQEDRLHPNQRAQEKILTTVWQKLQPLL